MISLRQTKPSRARSAKEDLALEIKFFEGVARRDPDYIEALQVLGDAYTKTGQWAKGLKIDQRLAQLCPENMLVFYNLACSFSLLNHLNEAFAALERAIQLGYDDASWMEQDPDLANLRGDKRFTDTRARLPKQQPESGR